MRRTAVLVLACLVACGESTAPVPGDLELFRARWESHAILSYDYVRTHRNEWFPPRTVRISVRDGVAKRMVDVDTGEEIPLTSRSATLTIPDLFDVAARALEEPDAVVDLRFDPNLGYPRVIAVDVPQWADDSYSFEVSGVVRR